MFTLTIESAPGIGQSQNHPTREAAEEALAFYLHIAGQWTNAKAPGWLFEPHDAPGVRGRRCGRYMITEA